MASGSAQVANATTSALGMGENHTAAARGFSAVAWNPAVLGMSGNPQTSGLIGAFQLLRGLRPITLGDLTSFAGEVVPGSVKSQWLADIQRAGGQRGGAGFDMTWAAVQSRRFALQVSSSGRSDSRITSDFAELLLFGNVDESGNARNLDVTGSRLQAHVHSSLALSFGAPISRRGDATRVAVGVTAKYTIGHMLLLSDESTGAAVADPLSLQLTIPVAYTPVVRDDGSHQLKSGGGFGVDVGVGYEIGGVSLAAVLHNVVNTFEWNQELIRYRPADLLFNDSIRHTSFSAQPLTSAPDRLRELVAASQFRPSLALGAAWRTANRITLAADLHLGSADDISTRPPFHIGAGTEYQLLNWLPIQLGLAYVRFDNDRAGVQYTAGIEAHLGGFTLGVSGGERRVGHTESLLMVTVLAHRFPH